MQEYAIIARLVVRPIRTFHFKVANYVRTERVIQALAAEMTSQKISSRLLENQGIELGIVSDIDTEIDADSIAKMRQKLADLASKHGLEIIGPN